MKLMAGFITAFLLTAVISFALIAKAVSDQHPHKPKKESGLKVWRNLNYVPDSKDVRQQLDVFVPQNGGPYPIILWIHGGAWSVGDKENSPAEAVAKDGFAMASMNYRLTNQAAFPSQIQDCKTAVRYLRAHAKEFNIDPKRIGVWGMSAGGHLAAMLATSGGVKEFEGKGWNDQSSAVQACVDYCGPASLAEIGAQTQGPQWKIDFSNPNSPMHLLLGRDVRIQKLLWASPATYVSRDDPPMQIIHGQADDVVPFAQSEALYRVLVFAGVPCEFTSVPSAGHNLYSELNLQRTMSFFQRLLVPRR